MRELRSKGHKSMNKQCDHPATKFRVRLSVHVIEGVRSVHHPAPVVFLMVCMSFDERRWEHTLVFLLLT